MSPFDQDSYKGTQPTNRKNGSERVAEIIAKWEDYNAKLESLDNGDKPVRKAPAKGPKKGCMKGKGGSENARCNYRGVRQRRWRTWVAEIREPHRGSRVWLGSFRTAIEAARMYDEAARAMYGSSARLNFPTNYSSQECMLDSSSRPTSSPSDSMNSGISEACYEDSWPRSCVSEMKHEDFCDAGTRISTVQGDAMLEPMLEEAKKEQNGSLNKTGSTSLCSSQGQYQYDSVPSDEMFDVDELPAALDSAPANASENQIQGGISQPCHQMQNLDLPRVEHGASEVDYSLDFLRPGREEDANITLYDVLLDLDSE